MVSFGNFFDRPAEEQKQLNLLPAGTYDAVIVDSKIKDTKTGKQMLELEFKITSGEYYNRSLWSRYMIFDTGAAGQIARYRLQGLELATGVIKPEDSTQWHDIPIRIVVKVAPARGDYGPSNEITNFGRATGAAAEGSYALPTEPDENSPW